MDSSCRKKSESETSQQQICCQNKSAIIHLHPSEYEGYCIWLYIMLYICLSANNSRPLQYHIDPLNLRQIVISDTSLSHSCAGSVVLANGNDAPEASEQLQHRSETGGSPYNTELLKKNGPQTSPDMCFMAPCFFNLKLISYFFQSWMPSCELKINVEKVMDAMVVM